MNAIQRGVPKNIWALVVAVVGTISIFGGFYFLTLVGIGAIVTVFNRSLASAVEPSALILSALATTFIVTRFARIHNGHWVEAITNPKHRHQSTD